jgi:hypothetical protein
MNLPALAPPKGRLTEAEARVIGAAANRLPNLRGLQAAQAGSGSLTVTTKNGAVSLTLTREDLGAILALLVEREACLLTQFDIELDAPAN